MSHVTESQEKGANSKSCGMEGQQSGRKSNRLTSTQAARKEVGFTEEGLGGPRLRAVDVWAMAKPLEAVGGVGGQ